MPANPPKTRKAKDVLNQLDPHMDLGKNVGHCDTGLDFSATTVNRVFALAG